MSDEMIAGTLERLRKVVDAVVLVMNAARDLEQAALLNRETDNRGEHGQAFITEALEHLVRRQGLVLTEQASEIAAQLGWQVAMYEIAPIARDSISAVSFITSNRYMPPLRDFSVSEEVYTMASDVPLADLWQAYVERLESKLEEERVYMAAPDYDNALYVVDLARFEYVEDAEGDSLEEWRPIAND